jgi:LPXTG-motif cell wall-anchored protein
VIEGLIDHQLLGIHHVRDDLGGPLGWDLAFLGLGVLLILGGLTLARRRRETSAA